MVLPDDASRIHEVHPHCRLRSRRRAAERAVASADSLVAPRIALLLVAIAPLGGVIFPAPPTDPAPMPLEVRDTAALLWLLCFVPAWCYLRRPVHRRRPLPILAIMGLEYAMYYALAPLLGVHNVYGTWEAGRMIRMLEPATDYLLPVRLALGGWVAILAGYAIARVIPLPGVRAAERLGREFDERTLAQIGFRLLAVGMAFELLRWTGSDPIELRGTIHFLARVSHVGLALLFALRARSVLPIRQRRLLLLATVCLIAMELGTGATYNVILTIFFAIMGGWIGRPRAGLGIVVGALAALALFASVRGVMADYRTLAWWSGVEYPLADRSRIMLGLLTDRLERDGALGMVGAGLHKVAERSANSDLLADVVRRTPSEIPYWKGATYASLIGFAVPRFLWPEKPVKLLGQDFGHRYDYIAPDDRRTHINLPVLVEFYANFGARGILLGSLLAGLFYAVAERYLNRPRQSVVVSIGALSLLEPFLVLELDLSLQLGGLFMNGIALLMLYHLLRHAWRDRIRPVPRRASGPHRVENDVGRLSCRRPGYGTPATARLSAVPSHAPAATAARRPQTFTMPEAPLI